MNRAHILCQGSICPFPKQQQTSGFNNENFFYPTHQPSLQADKNMEREIKRHRSGSAVYIICVYLLAMITDIRTLTSKFISDSSLMKSKFESYKV